LKLNWKIKLGILLLVISILLYAFAYFNFHEPDRVLFYIVIDLAFMPLDVFIVVLIVEGIISKKEKEVILEKLDMIMSVFFSEIGTDLLSKFSRLDHDEEEILFILSNISDWSERDFRKYLRKLKTVDYHFNLQLEDQEMKEFFIDLQQFLIEKRGFLIRLLENPNLLEKDSFSNLLLAIFHLDEELEKREFEEDLPASDYQHLTGDIDRVYSSLIYEWVNYLHYLKLHYPYMVSIAIRTNPFNKDATIYIDE
jgi:hypothetical protein